jgi:hypothetical protein
MTSNHSIDQGFIAKRRRTLGLGALAGLALLAASFSVSAQETVCGIDIKEQAAKEYAALDNLPDDKKVDGYKQIYEKYKFCAQDAQNIPANDPFFVAARQCGGKVSKLGSLAYEEMSCCGYDPQRRLFGCPIKIKQRGGFGAPPFPGSREFVLSCVQDPATGAYLPVALDSVHLANEIFGVAPTWQFAVIARATQNLYLVQPLTGQTRNARSILSWNQPPQSCNDQMIWGDAIDYRIRLDQ